jgi:hypothetical protein
MAFDLEEFVRLRPFVYHLTHTANVTGIKNRRRLLSASAIMGLAGSPTLIRQHRRGERIVAIDGEEIHIRDQDPLKPGNMRLDRGWQFADFIEHLNAHVFFWPGWERGPIGSGANHFARYASDHPAMLRISTADLFSVNESATPLFCKYNSGAPRYNQGRPSPRPANIFAPSESFAHRASNVVEVTFREAAIVPDSAEIGASPFGPWRTLW